jgi:predicted signal transduction protein with EAL and GGDEF domain
VPITISKSKYMAGVQCLKRLYWQVHEPELGGVPDAAAVAIMEQGREVGKLARLLFAGGVLFAQLLHVNVFESVIQQAQQRAEATLDSAVRCCREEQNVS